MGGKEVWEAPNRRREGKGGEGRGKERGGERKAEKPQSEQTNLGVPSKY